MQNSKISEEELAHIKFQVKNQIIEVMKKDLNAMKLKLHYLEENFENSLNAIPKKIQDNIAVLVEDVKYCKNYNCFCFKRK